MTKTTMNKKMLSILNVSVQPSTFFITVLLMTHFLILGSEHLTEDNTKYYIG